VSAISGASDINDAYIIAVSDTPTRVMLPINGTQVAIRQQACTYLCSAILMSSNSNIDKHPFILIVYYRYNSTNSKLLSNWK
jgi:hypothetical protein